MSNTKKNSKTPEELQAALQELIAQGRKDGMVRTSDLNALLEKMELSPEKIEEIYDRFEAMNIQLMGAELDLDDDIDLGDDLVDDVDLSGVEDEELVDPVDLAAVTKIAEKCFFEKFFGKTLVKISESGYSLTA